MNTMHEFLTEHLPSYAQWHTHSNRTAHHFMFLFAVAFITGVGLIAEIQNATPTYAQMTTTVGGVADVRQLNNSVLQLVKAYEAAPPENQSAAFSALQNAITERNAALVREMSTNPSKAALDVFPPGLIAQLPNNIAALLETETHISGLFVEYHIDYIDHRAADALYAVIDTHNNKRYAVYFSGGKPKNVKNGSTISASGVLLDNTVLFSGGSSSSTIQTTTVAPTTISTGAHKMLVVPITFTDRPTQTYSVADFTNWVFSAPDSVSAYYTQDSMNQIQFTGDVANPVAVPYTFADGCNSGDTIASSAESQLTAAGYTLSNYQHIFFWYPGSGCSWGGYAYYGSTALPYGRRAWAETQGMPYDKMVMIHELGHNLNANHANTLSCGSKSIDVASSCTSKEYGENHDPLGGYTLEHSNPAHKYEFSWIPSTNVATFTSSSGTFTYTLTPDENSSTGVQVVKIPKPDTNEYYYVGYRQPLLNDASLPAGLVAGAVIYTWAGGYYQTQLLDTTPGDGNFDNAGLSDGASFSDPINGITVTQMNHSTTSVTISVTKSGLPCVLGTPTVSVSPSSQTGPSGSVRSYAVSVTDTDSTSCTPNTFTLSSTVPGGWTGTLSPSSLSLSPAGTGSATVSVANPVGTVDASYGIAVQAVSGMDTTKVGAANATFVVFTDTIAPVVNITSPANGAKISGSNVGVSATATDAVGVVKVEFYLDGKVFTTDTATPYTAKINTRQQTKGSHTITVKAYDAAGNSGVASISVTI